ncbi:MAG: P44/Msp2 family outer membrane protein [Pseudomonadota bacterium]
MSRTLIRTPLVASALVVGAGVFTAASAQTKPYVSIVAGGVLQSESGNEGALGPGFVTGEGTTIPSGTALPNAPVGWTTEFDTGVFIAGAAGLDFGFLRAEIEVGYSDVGVDTHTNVVAGGIALGAEDAAVLIPNSPALGADVATIVGDGRGQIDQLTAFGNLIYDFDFGEIWAPYIGGGAGLSVVDVEYAPSGVTIVDDEKAVFAYQLLAGVNFNVSDELDWTIGYRFRMSEDVEVDTVLFPGTLEVENRSSNFEIGLRYRF